MASFSNSFALLEGSAPTASAAPSKKKKAKKNKKPASSALPLSGPSESHATAPRSEGDNAVDDGFQVAGRVSRKTSATNFKDTSPSRKRRTLTEGIADLETASSQAPFKDNSDRTAQWKSWRQQVSNCATAVLARVVHE